MYRLSVTTDFERAFKKLDRSVQILINKWIRKHLENCEDPRAQGKALVGNFKGFWRYRIGDYRLIVQICDCELILIALSIAHRSQVYKN